LEESSGEFLLRLFLFRLATHRFENRPLERKQPHPSKGEKLRQPERSGVLHVIFGSSSASQRKLTPDVRVHSVNLRN